MLLRSTCRESPASEKGQSPCILSFVMSSYSAGASHFEEFTIDSPVKSQLNCGWSFLVVCQVEVQFHAFRYLLLDE